MVLWSKELAGSDLIFDKIKPVAMLELEGSRIATPRMRAIEMFLIIRHKQRIQFLLRQSQNGGPLFSGIYLMKG